MAVEAAILDVFWRQGFNGTTLDDLSAAAGINRPSLYALIRSKNEAYLAALDRYMDDYGRKYLDALFSGGSLSEDLRAFFNTYLELTMVVESAGCPISCALPSDMETLPEARDVLSNAIRQIEDATRKRIELARKAGEPAPSIGATDAARLVASTMLALGVRSRAGETKAQLKRSARVIVSLLTR